MAKSLPPLKDSTIESRLNKAFYADEDVFLETLGALVQRMGVDYPFFGEAGFLHWACQHEKLIAIPFLLEKGADIHQKNQEGLTPLEALFQGDRKLTWQHSIHTNEADAYLQKINQKEKVALALLEAGASVTGDLPEKNSSKATSVSQTDKPKSLKGRKVKQLDWFETFVYFGYPRLTKWAIDQDLHLTPTKNKLNIGDGVFEISIKGFSRTQGHISGSVGALLLANIFQSGNQNPEISKPILEVLQNHTDTLDILLEHGLIPMEELNEERIATILQAPQEDNSSTAKLMIVLQGLIKQQSGGGAFGDIDKEQELLQALTAKLVQYRLDQSLPKTDTRAMSRQVRI